MRKRQIIEGTVIRRDFPNKGIVGDLIKVGEKTDDKPDQVGEAIEGTCLVKNTLPGQRIKGIITKSGKNRLEARLLEVIKEAPDAVQSPCPHFGICGSCHYLSMTYEKELELKEQQVKKLLSEAFKRQAKEPKWDGIKKSPIRK